MGDKLIIKKLKSFQEHLNKLVDESQEIWFILLSWHNTSYSIVYIIKVMMSLHVKIISLLVLMEIELEET